jgi:RNA polymerase sigma-70 factor (ECF subfamily)
MGEDVASRLREAGERRGELLGALFEEHRARLRRMVDIRMDPRLRGRIDASDVLQDAWLEVADRIDEYVANPQMPFPLWVRFIAGQKLVALHRHHVGTKKRDVRRQRPIEFGGAPGATAAGLAYQLIAAGTTPTMAAARGEFRARLVGALESMEPIDREVLVLRHFEQFQNAEVAVILGLAPTTASNRYVRALRRLKDVLAGLGAGDHGLGAQEP